MAKGEERGEEVGVSREHLRPEMAIQEADRLLKGLGASSGGARGKSLGGESSRVEGGGEESGEDWIGGERL